MGQAQLLTIRSLLRAKASIFSPQAEAEAAAQAANDKSTPATERELLVVFLIWKRPPTI